MSILNSLINFIKSDKLSDSELLTITNAVKERRPDLFNASLEKIEVVLSGNLTPQPFQINRNFYRCWKFTQLPLEKNYEPVVKKLSKEYKSEEYKSEHLSEDKRFDRIAVVLIGEWRTGSFLAKYTHKFFNAMAKNIDYYIVTYDNVSLETVLESYPQAVVKLISRETNKSWPKEVFLRRAVLCSQALALIGDKLTEYNQIVEARPDVYMRIPEIFDLQECKENEGTHCEIWYRKNRDQTEKTFPTNIKHISELKNVDESNFISQPDATGPCFGAGDTYIRLHPETFKKYANRYNMYKNNRNFLTKYCLMEPCPHLLLAKTLVDYQINNIGFDCPEHLVIRDKNCQYIDLDNFDFGSLSELNKKPITWDNTPKWTS